MASICSAIGCLDETCTLVRWSWYEVGVVPLELNERRSCLLRTLFTQSAYSFNVSSPESIYQVCSTIPHNHTSHWTTFKSTSKTPFSTIVIIAPPQDSCGAGKHFPTAPSAVAHSPPSSPRPPQSHANPLPSAIPSEKSDCSPAPHP